MLYLCLEYILYSCNLKILFTSLLNNIKIIFIINNIFYLNLSGESGAGKTEATKQCLNYLAYSAGSSSGIQAKILKASPVLEGWGNAKTLRNNNSSRFGKFIEIWFDNEHMITGASNTTYILEKSRVVYQEKDERNYHIFYQLLKGADSKLLHDLELEEFALNPEKLFYINQSGCINIEDVDDAQDFNEANQALIDMGFTPEEQVSLYAIIAGILLLGNVSFDPHPTNSEESIIAPESRGMINDSNIVLYHNSNNFIDNSI